MNMRILWQSIPILVSLPAMLHGQLALAQAAPDTNNTLHGLTEVIVTAQRRAEGVQSVPVSITAFSSEDLELYGMQSAGDLASQVPNVQFDTVGQSPRFTIRGIRMLNESDNNEPPIAYYRDDVYRSTWSAQMGQLFDVDRVEVLRGPQGTLFGRNATGGLMHIVSRRPTEEFSGYAEVQLGSWGSSLDERIVEGAVSGPFTDALRGRLSFKYNNSDGWQEGCGDVLCTNPIEIGKTNILGVRGQLQADLSSNGSLLFIIEGVDQDSKSDLWSMRGTLDPATGDPCAIDRIEANGCVDITGWGDPNLNPKKVYTTAPDLPNKLRMISPSAKLEWKFDGFDLTAITAFENLNRLRLDDGLGGLGFDPAWSFVWKLHGEQFTQEVRLDGEWGERLTWIAGAFYFNDKKTGYIAFDNLTPIFGTDGWQNDWTQKTESWATFGQVDWKLTDRVTLTGGVRYTDEDKTLFITDSLVAPNFVANERFSKGNVTGRAAIEYEFTDDVMAYASVATGFKSAASNAELVTEGQTAPVAPEELTSYEIGLKSTLLDRRLRFNLSGFYYDYDGIQQAAIIEDATSTNVIVRLRNVGKAEVYGLESEIMAEVTDNIQAGFGAGLTESELTGVPSLLIGGAPIDGNKLAQTPEVSLNGYIRYRVPLASNGEVTVQTDFDWQGESESTFENDPSEKIASRGFLNVRGFWASADDRYHVNVYVDNVTNKMSNRGWHRFDFAGLQYANWFPPRSYGAQFGVKF